MQYVRKLPLVGLRYTLPLALAYQALFATPTQAQSSAEPFRSAATVASLAEPDCKQQGCARPCDDKQRTEILAPAQDSRDVVFVTCSITLKPSDVVTRQIVLSPLASGSIFDCGGATLANPHIGTQDHDYYRIFVRSTFDKNAARWQQAHDIVIKNCHLYGAVSVGGTMSSQEVKQSSFTPGHTQKMQTTSPRNVKIMNLNISSVGEKPLRTMLFVGMGTTNLTLSDSTMSGSVQDTALYLDAETSGAVIERNVFSVHSNRRELIAIDGSANNYIADNIFIYPSHGAIYIYRNCGENGIIRHQEPRRNRVVRNIFSFHKGIEMIFPVIWVASREKLPNGRSTKSWCDMDKGAPFGSSENDSDFAKDNSLVDNHFVNTTRSAAVVVDDPDNVVSGSTFE